MMRTFSRMAWMSAGERSKSASCVITPVNEDVVVLTSPVEVLRSSLAYLRARGVHACMHACGGR